MGLGNAMHYYVLLIIFFTPLTVLSKTIITYPGGLSGPPYVKKLLELSLEKTKSDFGDFELISTYKNETHPRLIRHLDDGTYKNFVIKVSVTDDVLQNYNIIKFPIDRGMSGFRVAFSSVKMDQKNCDNINLDNILDEPIVQGSGWLDTDILKYNHFKVHPVATNQQMFNMIARKRVRYFFRGINELLYESSKFPNLFIEPCFALKYPLPRFFVTNKRDIDIAKRIETGLERAYKDGSLIKLWRTYYIKSIQLANMKERQIFELKNPFIKTLDDDYLKYDFKFSELDDH